MAGPQRRKGRTAQNKVFHRSRKTKHYMRDTDQIYEDVKPQNRAKYEKQPINEDLPGLGQYYCIPCSRYFNNQQSMQTHFTTQIHQQAEKRLKEKPYDHQEAEEAAKY